MMHTPVSEEVHVDLLSTDDAIWIDGIGWIGQYYNYIDQKWEKGLPFFVRDYYLTEALGTEMLEFIKSLNSEIETYVAQTATNPAPCS
jgi:hypothetical protein